MREDACTDGVSELIAHGIPDSCANGVSYVDADDGSDWRTYEGANQGANQGTDSCANQGTHQGTHACADSLPDHHADDLPYT